MDAALRALVRQRAGDRCEYCRMPQAATPFIPFHVEHIIAKQHVEEPGDDPNSICLACDRCNAYKGSNIATLELGEIVTLFHPRRDQWTDHFRLRAGVVEGITPKGRATVRLLNMNAPRRVALRRMWVAEGESQL